jgi:type II secretory pathway pseudopilin PulG
MGEIGRRPQGRMKRRFGLVLVMIAIAGLAAASVAVRRVQAQQVAQVSDFLKDQEKLRRQTQRLRRSKTARPATKRKKAAQHRRAKKTHHAARPRPSSTTATTAAKKPPSADDQPKTREARRAKSKVEKDESPKDKPNKEVRAGPEIPKGRPAYIRTKEQPVAKALGADIAEKIFSHEFTPVRQLAISHSARVIPGYECPSDPPVALTDIVPFKVKPGVTSWIEGYVVGCKPRTKRSFLVMLENGKPQFAELLPGLSIADPLLQRDAVAGAEASVKAEQPKGCNKSIVADTRLAEPLTAAGGPWVELWTLNQCGKERHVEMRFTPSKEGGTRWTAKLIR